MSSFKGLNLFGSGPHRFSLAKQGHLLTSDFFFGGAGGGSTAQGLIDLDVVVRGRLIAASDASLWTLRDSVAAQLLDPPTPGTLIDEHGRSWAGMSFVGYVEEDRVDRGRVVSVGYEAVFRKM